MNYKMMGKFLGTVLLIEAALLTVPMAVALIYGESIMPYLLTVALLLPISVPTVFLTPKNKRIYAKDGFVCVALSWIFLSLFGAMPFIFSGAIPSFIDAVFETVSGFTTTGASILTDIECLPRGILFWRSFTHWIGGMGILVFMLALLSNLEGNAIFLMRAEVPGPQKGKLVPKLRESSMLLYFIYLILTVAEVIALLIAGLPLYDSLINAFGTMGTGGFSVLNSSIGGYGNPAVEWIMAIFLLLAGVNYNIYYFLLVKKLRDVKKNDELKAYLLIIIASSAIIAVNLYKSMSAAYGALPDAIRAAFFQVVSVISTAGFTTDNFAAWPYLSQSVLFLLMFIGACAGSTAGGFKISRFIIMLKGIKREVRKIFKPNSVQSLRLDGEVLDEKTVSSAMNYMSLYMIIMAISFVLVSFDGKDLISTVSAVVATFNNVGPGLGEAFSNFASFSDFSKIVLTLDMLFGRLEIMPMLVLITPAAWRKN